MSSLHVVHPEKGLIASYVFWSSVRPDFLGTISRSHCEPRQRTRPSAPPDPLYEKYRKISFWIPRSVGPYGQHASSTVPHPVGHLLDDGEPGIYPCRCSADRDRPGGKLITMGSQQSLETTRTAILCMDCQAGI